MLLFKMAESIQAGLNKTDGKWQNEDEVDTACRLRNPYVLTAFAPGLQKLVATSPKQTKKTKLRQFPRNGEQKPSNSQTPSLRRKTTQKGGLEEFKSWKDQYANQEVHQNSERWEFT